MKILFVVNNYFATGNGLSASARRTVQALKDAGQDVRVLSGPNPDAAGPRPEYLLQKYNFPIFQPIISAHGYQFAAGWHTGTSQFALDSRSVFPEKDAKALAAFGDFTGSTVAANTAYLAR
ncbi:MAG: hypothetical protein IJP55_05210 [Bacteroidales bacterium]|nr:hypothetical protein [Bacteroidales bacterium]